MSKNIILLRLLACILVGFFGAAAIVYLIGKAFL